jgi:hypothetical protein
MQTPLTLSALTPRGIEDIAAAAHAVQANVVALRVAWCKRTGEPIERHDIKTPSPGPVRKLREILIDWRVLRDYTAEQTFLRTRQVWGEFCALCWLFPFVDPQAPIHFDPLPSEQSLRCLNDVHEKLAEVQTGLARILSEQRRRQAPVEGEGDAGPPAPEGPPMRIGGRDIRKSSDEELLANACEYAGMLAAFRWATDDRWIWEGPGIMDLPVGAVLSGPHAH